ncbi:MAG TPA: antibiotic biosynthesis monooxygenase [Kineosporiaceae bacterium]
MYLQHVKIVVLGGQESAFEAALCEVRQRVFMSPGFRGFTVAQDAERPGTYLVQMRWETLEELAEHTERFDRCWAPLDPFLAAPLRSAHYVERPGLAFQGPGVITDLAWLSAER